MACQMCLEKACICMPLRKRIKIRKPPCEPCAPQPACSPCDPCGACKSCKPSPARSKSRICLEDTCSTNLMPDTRDMMMLPYIGLVAFYMYARNYPEPKPKDQDRYFLALAKAAPLIFLAAYVGLTTRFEENALALSVRAGLVLAGFGDIVLMLFKRIGGRPFAIAAFFLQIMAYICGISAWFGRGEYSRDKNTLGTLFGLVCLGGFVYLASGIPSLWKAVITASYALLLVCLANLAMQRHLVEGNRGSFLGLAGALMLLVSDLMYVVNKWKTPLMHANLAGTITYYAAQWAVTAGAVYSKRRVRC